MQRLIFFRKIGFLPFFYKHLWKGPSWRLLFWFKLLFMDSATWNLFKKPWLIKIWEDLAEKQQKMWQRLEILKKFQNLSKKKDTPKIGPKSKNQKHRKLPTNEYYRRMKSFFLNIEPILSVFFFDMSFSGFSILSRHPKRVSNYRKFEQNSSGLPFCITNDCFLLLFPYNARKMHLKWFGSFLKIAVLAHFCHNIVPGISNRVLS